MERLLTTLAAALLAIAPTEGQTKRTPAFPGAEGYGMYVTGGRGGKVYHVTTLDDTGEEGSLRHAINQSGARTVVFDVSGTIFLKSALQITNGDLTIAGQTAPGDGICIADWPVTLNSKNVILRYLRFRCGNANVSRAEGDGGHEGDGLGGMDGANYIIDHCSVSWSVDECLSVYGNRNTTVQWCIASHSLRMAGHSKGAHGYGGMMGGGKATYHHNLIANHDSRTPRFVFRTGDETSKQHPTDYRNNVIYNYGKNGAYGAEDMDINLVNNYYKPGPFTKKQPASYQKRMIAPGVGTHKDENGDVTEYVWGHYHLSGNKNADWQDVTEDNYTIGLAQQVASSNYGWNATTRDTIRMDEPMPFALVTTHTADKAFEKVLAYAGASLHRDLYDQAVVSDAENGTASFTGPEESDRPGIIDSPDDITYSDGTTGWPALESKSAPADDDGDGIPDVWEDAHGLDAADPTDGNATNAEGYTNLEVYINSLVANITEQQAADGETLGEDIASTGELNPPSSDDENVILIPSDDYLPLDKLLTKSDGSLANGGELKEVDGTMTIDNARNGDYVTFTLYNTVAQKYRLDFKACTNRGSSEVITLDVRLTDADETAYADETLTIAKTSWTDFQPYSVETAELPEGLLYLTIAFNNSNGKYTANAELFKLTGMATGISAAAAANSGTEAPLFDIGGRPAPDGYKGIVVSKGKKAAKGN